MKKGILKSIVALGVIIAISLTAAAAFAQDDMQEAKASFLGAGVKFKMDRPSMKARNLESANSDQVKQAVEYKSMDNGLLSGAFNGGSGEGVRSRPIKDTKIVCEVCKAKAVVNASENCEFCKGKSYADLCDKCIAWSILNSCDECKTKIRSKMAKKEEAAAVKEEKAPETASDEAVKTAPAESFEEITADETAAEKAVEKPKTKKKASKKSKAKAAKKVEKSKEVKPVIE